VYLAVIGAVGFMAYSAFRATQDQAVLKASQDRLVANHGLIQPIRRHLAPEYMDKDGGLLADPPTDAKQLLIPNTLVLAHYEDDEVDTQPVN
jgi:hypothetical protein